jgi:hypothetical protein
VEQDEVRQWRSIQKAIVALRHKRFQTPRLIRRREQLIEAEREISDLFMEQGTDRYRGGHVRKRMRAALRKHHLNPISRDGMLILEGEPGIKDQLRLPHLRVSDPQLIKDARRIINNAKPFADSYIADGTAPDFIENAERAVDEFEQRISTQAKEVAERAHATAALPAALLKGRKIMTAVTGIVEDELAGDIAAQRLWKRAKRLPRTMGRPKNNARGRQIFPPRDDATTA